MKRPWLLCAPAAFLLSSATPPPATSAFALEPEKVLDLYPICVEGQECTLLAGAPEQEALQRSRPLPEMRTEQASRDAQPSPPGSIKAPLLEDQPDAVPAPEPAEYGDDLRILVSIPQQKAYVFQAGELVATSPVSTGRRGHETPVGTFRILQKKVYHRSNRYANAPMPYMQRLTSYGIALHAGSLPGYPASHGCIRLPRHFAKKLYDLTDMGTRVTITHRRPKSADEALTLA